MKRESRLGIVDWGIGGIGIYKLIKERLGDVPVTYFSDTGVTAYGTMSRSELISRLDKVVHFLRGRGVTHLVIGCNAASTVLSSLDIGDMKVVGVIESAVRVSTRMHPTRLALIGGRRTVLSRVYRRAFAARGIDVTQRIAQPLSALIESGDTSSNTLRDECRKILAPIRNSSHLLLACTHYSAITAMLKEFLSTDTVVINPAAKLVSRIRKWKLEVKGGEDSFLTSGDPRQMKNAARHAFGVNISVAKRVRI